MDLTLNQADKCCYGGLVQYISPNGRQSISTASLLSRPSASSSPNLPSRHRHKHHPLPEPPAQLPVDANMSAIAVHLCSDARGARHRPPKTAQRYHATVRTACGN